MSTATTADFSELFEKSASLFENALKAGVTVQQDSAKWFADTLRGLGVSQQWPSKNKAALETALAAAKKNVNEGVQLMSENVKASLDLLDKAFQARHTDSEAENRDRAREMWEGAVASLRKNTETMVQANARVIESWASIARMMCGEAAQNNS
jgi:hypothetical protein